MKNRGEITTQKLVMIIILIVSFVVILFFIFRLNLGQTSDKQICHNSVVLKSSGRGLAGTLNCRTNYLCISGGGKCEDMNPSETVKVNLDSDNSEEEIMKAIADEMADCWWMFGEGELDYLNLREKGLSRTTCALCSIVSFDDTILEEDYEISYREFYNYLNDINIDETKTYFDYLYDSGDIDEFQKDISQLSINIDNSYILEGENYAIITGFDTTVKKIFPPDVRRGYIYPTYLKSSEISSELGCQEFVTQA